MFFGMCNSLATFQAIMDKIFKKEIEDDLIIVYTDDVLGFSKTINRLKKIILEKAQEHDLFFKAKKCEFQKQKIEYLGLVVQKGKLAMNLAKLQGILEWPTPKNSERSTILLRIFIDGSSRISHTLSTIF